MFEFSFTLDEKDYLEFSLHNQYHLPVNNMQVQLTRFVPPLLFMALAFLLASASGDSVYYYVYAVLSLAWILLYKKYVNWNIRYKIRQIKKAGKLPFSREAVVFRCLEDCLIEETATTETKTGYAHIERVLEGDAAVYLYVSALSSFIIPNRAFADDGEKKRLVDFVRSKIENAGEKSR